MHLLLLLVEHITPRGKRQADETRKEEQYEHEKWAILENASSAGYYINHVLCPTYSRRCPGGRRHHHRGLKDRCLLCRYLAQQQGYNTSQKKMFPERPRCVLYERAASPGLSWIARQVEIVARQRRGIRLRFASCTFHGIPYTTGGVKLPSKRNIYIYLTIGWMGYTPPRDELKHTFYSFHCYLCHNAAAIIW